MYKCEKIGSQVSISKEKLGLCERKQKETEGNRRKQKGKNMKLSNLKKVNDLNSNLKNLKNKLVLINAEGIEMDYVSLVFKNDDRVYLEDIELLEIFRNVAQVYIPKRIKEIKEQLIELGVEIEDE